MIVQTETRPPAELPLEQPAPQHAPWWQWRGARSEIAAISACFLLVIIDAAGHVVCSSAPPPLLSGAIVTAHARCSNRATGVSVVGAVLVSTLLTVLMISRNIVDQRMPAATAA